MEDLDQAYGYVLYRTNLDAGAGGDLVLDGLHDYAQVYLDEKMIGTLDRRLATSELKLPVTSRPARLDILVENSGRVNFTTVIRGERKGITGKVTLAGKELRHWQNYSLPMNDLTGVKFDSRPCTGPCFHRRQLTISEHADTYLDFSSLHKGFVWVNQQPLGRFWSVGPQHTLYLPEPWLKQGQNEIVYFDIVSDATEDFKSVDKPIFDRALAHRE